MHLRHLQMTLKHFSDCLFYFCSTCADSITNRDFKYTGGWGIAHQQRTDNEKNTNMYMNWSKQRHATELSTIQSHSRIQYLTYQHNVWHYVTTPQVPTANPRLFQPLFHNWWLLCMHGKTCSSFQQPYGLPSRTSYQPALCFSSSVIFLLVWRVCRI